MKEQGSVYGNTMDLSRNDDRPKPARPAERIWPPGRSASRLSPGLRPPPLCRYAERPSDLILQAGLVCVLRKPPTLPAEGGAVGGVAKCEDLWDRPLALSPTRNGMLEDQRRPQAGGHSRSHPLHRLRPTHAWTSILALPRQAASGRLGQNGVMNFGTLHKKGRHD